MKQNIKIKTLSQVHIGSGETLHKGTDFLVREERGTSYIYIIDPDRIGLALGRDRDAEKLFQLWTASIENGNTEDFFTTAHIMDNPLAYSKRRIVSYAINKADMTLKECMHDGRGIPYIPGSSLKGAIRTAIATCLLDKQLDKSIRKRIVDQRIWQDDRGRWHVKSKPAEADVLGSINDSLMRFVRVGDAFFGKGSEIAVTEVSLNIREDDELLDKKNQQAVEAIDTGQTARFSIDINRERYNKAASSAGERLRAFPPDFATIPALFSLINDHTKALVESDISFWEEQQEEGYMARGGELDNYMASMKGILSDISKCQTGECVLRVGQASGWRFMTGAWTESLDNFSKKVIPASRPHNDEKYWKYKEFPKTRRIDLDAYPFGFVKLSII